MRASKKPLPSAKYNNQHKLAADEAAKTEARKRLAGWLVEAIGGLSRECGIDTAALIEEFDERAAVREYCGAATREEAERGAWEDLASRYRSQLAMAV